MRERQTQTRLTHALTRERETLAGSPRPTSRSALFRRFHVHVLAALLACLCLNAQAQTMRLLVQSSPLAGFAHYDAATSFDEIKVGDALTLIREPDNPYDVNAVRVDWHGIKLGYLPRRENRAVAAEIDRGGKVEARVARLRQHPNPRERVLIEIYAVL